MREGDWSRDPWIGDKDRAFLKVQRIAVDDAMVAQKTVTDHD